MFVFRRILHDRKRPNHHHRTPQALGARPADAADVRRFSTGGVDTGSHTLVQLVFAIFNDEPNRRLQRFGSGVGLYLAQIASFVTFATETAPFPFSDWPESLGT